MASSLKLWISPETGRLLANGQSFVSAPQNQFFFGNSIELELHQVLGVSVSQVPYETSFPSGATAKVAIGNIGSPTSGTWTLTVGANTTTNLEFDATPSEVASALNALASVTADGGLTVAALGRGYSITWNTVGTKPDILPGSDTLVPSSYEAIYTVQEGSALNREIVFVELRQNPVALAESFVAIGTPVVSVTTVSAWNGSNKVVRTLISPSPKEGFFTFTAGANTAVIQAYGGSADYRTSLNNAGISASVIQSGILQFDITLNANLAVSVDGSGLIESPGLKGTLNLGTPELISFLGSENTKEAIIEISVEAAGAVQTLVQVPCQLSSGVLLSGAATPVQVGVLLTEAVANSRFIRRDASQSPTGADLDIIWPNLGVTADGSDVAAAISGAASPASGNVFATMADVGVNPFDQDLNTTDSVTFAGLTIPDGGSGGFNFSIGAINALDISDGTSTLSVRNANIVFPDSTAQTTAFIPADYLAKSGNLSGLASNSTARTNLGLGTMAVETASNYLTTASASSTYLSISTASSTYAPLTDFDQGVKTTDSVTFAGVLVTDGLTAGVDIDELGITFPDATIQESAPVHSAGTSIHSGGGGHIDGNDYPDEIRIVIGGVTYAMPARVI